MKKFLFLFISLFIWLSCKAPQEKYVPPSTIEVIELDGGTYEIPLYLLITDDTSLARKSIDTIIKDGDGGYNMANTEAETFSAAGWPIVLWIPKLPYTTGEYAILNHETFHVVSATMRYVGIPLTEETDEAYAYQISYISRELLEKIKELKEK